MVQADYDFSNLFGSVPVVQNGFRIREDYNGTVYFRKSLFVKRLRQEIGFVFTTNFP